MAGGPQVALVTDATGPDGAHLAQLLPEQGSIVRGVKRRSTSFNTGRIEAISQDPHVTDPRFILHHGDLTDATNLIRIVQESQPDEISNCAAQSHGRVSFETPECTANADGIGTLRLLAAIRILGLQEKARFCQAATSELDGLVQEAPQRETTPLHPRSPCAAARLDVYWIVENDREAHGLHACDGSPFNHESPLRGETFVTRKITRAAAAIRLGKQGKLYLGNPDTKRDWGGERGMWLMLQQDRPSDHVPATGETTEVRQIVDGAFEDVGFRLEWRAHGLEEKGYDRLAGKCVVEVAPRSFRPTEVDRLIGDPTKAREKLGRRHETSARDLCREMANEDLKVMWSETVMMDA